MSLNQELQEVIRKECRKIFEELYDGDWKTKQKNNNAYYKRTETLLRAYNDLKQLVSNAEEYITKYQKSKDVVYMPSGAGKAFDEAEEERIQSRRESLELTKMDLEWLEMALDSVRNDEWFEIIERRYFQKRQMKELFTMFPASETTVKEHRNRLVKQISRLMFGTVVDKV